jgi:hypothetical protein
VIQFSAVAAWYYASTPAPWFELGKVQLGQWLAAALLLVGGQVR